MPTRSFSRYVDGWYGTPKLISRRPRDYPFGHLGDLSAARYAANYLVDGNRFIPTARGTQDPDVPGFFLFSESKPDFPFGDLATITRIYGNVPGDQVSYASRVITKPAISSLAGADDVNMQLVTGASTSTNLGANFLHLNHWWDIVNNRVYGPLAGVTSATSGSDRRVTWTSHGLAGTERIAYGSGPGGAFYLYAPGQYTVIDPNTIDLLGWPSLSNAYAAKFLRDYTAGTDRVGLRQTQKFYLPSPASSITTPSSIPIPDTLLADPDLINSLLANLTGYQTYDASELTFWGDSPVYTQTLFDINMADL
jgi:hypothetical protein